MKTILGLILTLSLALPTPQSYAQQKGHIQGHIVDADTKQPLIGAHVMVMETTLGGATDAEGYYRIEHLEEDVYKLKISYIGYVDFIEVNVLVIRGKTTQVDEIQLASLPLLGGSVTVTPEFVTTPVSHHALQREEIRRNPGTAGDVLRAVGSLPGVSTSEGEFSAMSVRGSGVYDNLILIDNIPFEKINHFEGGSNEQETQGGRFSVFTSGMIERATFFGGGFGAEHGRKSASVLDLSIKEGNTESPTINGIYDLLGLELNYDGPTYLLKNTSLVLNVRDYDMKAALKLADAEDFGDPTMADVIAKTTTHLNALNKISLLGIYSTDRLLRGPDNIFKADDLVENDVWDIDETRWLFGVNWRFLTSNRSVLHNTFFFRGNNRFRSIGHAWADGFDGQLPPTQDALSFREGVGIQYQDELELGWKSDFHYDLGNNRTINAGFELYNINLDYSFTQNGADTLYQFTTRDLQFNPEQKYIVLNPEDVNYSFDEATTNISGYATYDFSIGKLMLTPGIRYSHSGFSNENYLAPRLQLRYQLAQKTVLNFATGIYYQKPLNRYIALDPQNKSLQDEKSTHFILGVNQQLRSDLQFTLEGYYKTLDQLITPSSTSYNLLANNGDGWSSGFDAMLIKRFTHKYFGQITYSYAVSKRNDRDGLGEYNFALIQPHNFAIRMGYEINKEWFLSARWKYAVGRPKDAFILHKNVFNSPTKVRFSKEITERNADRVPDFHVLSIRVDYRKQIGRLGLITFLDLDNLYNRPNIYEDRFSELTGKEKGLGFGFLPNFGLKLEF